ncbi:MAG: TIGR03619 family F420-dependent LLM class oxidoreductase [Chloroflexi bacterium]|nr:TIGR03619 family F420-dependent LLM class oxidoreductase [Chloroflexota bacterium]
MHVGVALPVTLDPDAPADLPAALLRYARHAEELGFASLWVTDHLLTGHAIYAVPRLEPMATLMHLAGATTRARLGTAVLILPWREPLTLAKQAATVHYLSGERLILGVGPGWDPAAFAALGMPMRERGARTDEALVVLGRLFREREVTHEGRFFSFSGVTIDPLPREPIPLWIGGGSQVPSPNAPNPPVLAPSVRRRVVRAAGWIPRPTGTVDQLASDWREIRAEMAAQGRDPATLARALKVYVHMVDTGDRAKAYAIQEPLVRRVVSSQFPWPYLTQIICVGTPQDCVDLLRRKIEAVAATEVILGDYVLDERQLDLWAEKLLPHLH